MKNFLKFSFVILVLSFFIFTSFVVTEGGGGLKIGNIDSTDKMAAINHSGGTFGKGTTQGHIKGCSGCHAKSFINIKGNDPYFNRYLGMLSTDRAITDIKASVISLYTGSMVRGVG